MDSGIFNQSVETTTLGSWAPKWNIFSILIDIISGEINNWCEDSVKLITKELRFSFVQKFKDSFPIFSDIHILWVMLLFPLLFISFIFSIRFFLFSISIVNRSGFEQLLHQLPSVWPWLSYLIFLKLSFLFLIVEFSTDFDNVSKPTSAWDLLAALLISSIPWPLFCPCMFMRHKHMHVCMYVFWGDMSTQGSFCLLRANDISGILLMFSHGWSYSIMRNNFMADQF